MGTAPDGMPLNAGGQVPSGYVVGRDAAIDGLWRALESQNVLLTAERRTGKTVVLHKMASDGRPGWLPIYSTLEAVTSADEFIKTIVGDLQRHTSIAVTDAQGTLDRVVGTMQRLGIKLKSGAIEFDPSLAPSRTWTEVLTGVLTALDEQTDLGGRPVLLWDEFPQMLDNITRAGGAPEARQILDVLRGFSQRPGVQLRLLLTGSIGLHHIVSRLRDGAGAWAPTNHMASRDLGPLGEDDAAYLASELLATAAIDCATRPSVASRIAIEVDGLPFFIQKTVGLLRDRRATWTISTPLTPDAAASLIAEQLESADDPFELEHPVFRVLPHFGEAAPLARATLDEIAQGDTAGMDFDSLVSAISVALGTAVDREELARIVDLLCRDHQLARGGGRIQFRTTMGRRIWRARRHLG